MLITNRLFPEIMRKMIALTDDLSRRFGTKATFIAVDVTSTSSIRQLAEKIQSQFEGVQILCNNAGTVLGVPSAIHTYDTDAWHKTLDVNLNGVFQVSKVIVPLMMKSGGSVINIASRVNSDSMSRPSALNFVKSV